MDNIEPAYTFDDVLLKPRYAGFSRAQVSLRTQLTKKIKLEIPLVASPMDTVTESRLATALAHAGGVGIIHRNLTIDDQTAEVAKVVKKGLLVGAAVGSSPGYEERVKALVQAGASVILIDSAHGHTQQVIKATTHVKKNYDVQIISGNIATGEGAEALIKAGASGLRVGMGPGAICSTRVISGMGVPQITAIRSVAKVAQKYKVPVIADGGINYSGDITKALAAGASSVMLGRLFAATKESAGQAVQVARKHVPHRFQSIINGNKYYIFKKYRGMGSVAAMKRGIKVSSEDEYHGKSYTDTVLVAEGVEGMVPLSGSVQELCNQICGGIQSGFYYCGAKSIHDLWETAQFMRISQASLTESHPHNLFITNAGNNYQ